MYNPQLFKFETTDHIFLPGLLYKPDKKTKNVAIYLHGNGSSSIFYAVDRMNAIASKLNKQSIAFFPFNNRGAHFIKSLTQKKNDEEEKVIMGMTYELVSECIHDIDGAIHFLKSQGYTTFYLIGHSTGATKIVLYHYLKPDNEVSKFILLAGGDDVGIYFRELGEKKFNAALHKSKVMIDKGQGRRLVTKSIAPFPISYQSLYDTLNPNGDYNVFPFYEYFNKLHLSTKPLFHAYKSINKKTLVIYGSDDEYCENKVKEYIELLKIQAQNRHLFTFETIDQADHSFSGKETELAQTISDWLAKD